MTKRTLRICVYFIKLMNDGLILSRNRAAINPAAIADRAAALSSAALRNGCGLQHDSSHYLRASTRNLRPPIDSSFHFGAAADMLPLANSPRRSSFRERSSAFAVTAPTSSQ